MDKQKSKKTKKKTKNLLDKLDSQFASARRISWIGMSCLVNQKKKEEKKKELPMPETKAPPPSTPTSITNTTDIARTVEKKTVVEEKTQAKTEGKERELHSSIRNVNSRGRTGGFKTETVLGGIPPSIQRPAYKQIVVSCWCNDE